MNKKIRQKLLSYWPFEYDIDYIIDDKSTMVNHIYRQMTRWEDYSFLFSIYLWYRYNQELDYRLNWESILSHNRVAIIKEIKSISPNFVKEVKSLFQDILDGNPISLSKEVYNHE